MNLFKVLDALDTYRVRKVKINLRIKKGTIVLFTERTIVHFRDGSESEKPVCRTHLYLQSARELRCVRYCRLSCRRYVTQARTSVACLGLDAEVYSAFVSPCQLLGEIPSSMKTIEGKVVVLGAQGIFF